MTPGLTADERTVLHALRCMGSASLDRVRATVAPDGEDVEDVLIGLAARGLLTRDRGPFGGWCLTPRGTGADDDAIADELRSCGAAPRVRGAYDRFLPLNSRVLDVCSAWQVRSFTPGVQLNDHRDPTYDARVLDRLAAVHADAAVVLDELTDCLPRFARYGRGLSHALDRARAGEVDQVTDSMDSYHTVWFQLHEDLLSTLGRTRDDERG